MHYLRTLQTKAIAILTVAALSLVAMGDHVQAQANPFDGGWTLQPAMSALNFQSVKKQTVVESSSFATLEGTIGADGATEVRVLLDSVDTKIDLRNVRMRFLFFETFKFPTATITTQINAALLDDLRNVRRKTVPVSYTMDLHGVTQTYDAEVAVTLLGEDLVSVASTTPISVSVDDFNLLEGLGKLQDAANVTIIPSATISFDFVFARNSTTAAVVPAPSAAQNPQSVALEVEGDFDREACKGRFEILSRTGNIYFPSGSARHDAKSEPLLNSLAGIIARCPNMVIEVGGHTDSLGSNATNQRLSDRRAEAVKNYLISRDVGPDLLVSKGYGETNPLETNDTQKGRWANRRIEFKVLSN